MTQIQPCSDPNLFAQSLTELRNSHAGFKASIPTEILTQMVASPLPPKKRFFTATREGSVVATLAANVSLTEPSRGYLGFFEIHPEAADCFPELLKSATEFLHAQGVSFIFAPVNYSTWFSYRFQEPFADENRFAWEPQNPPMYLGLFKEAGFTVASQYNTIGMASLLTRPKVFGLDQAA